MRLLLILLLLPAPAQADWALATAPNTPENVALLRDLGAGIEGGDRDRILFDLPLEALPAAQALLPLELLSADTALLRPLPSMGERDVEYHDPETVAASLRSLAATWPDLARVVDVGDSVLGQDLLALLLTDRPWEREVDEPSLRVLGTHHGDEWSSMEVPLALAWSLAEAYADGDPGVVELLDGNELWIAPVINPDGVDAFQRRNAHNVDLNRNYDYEWLATSWSGPAPFSEPETRAVRALSLARSFHHSLSMHSGATNIGWVWNWALTSTPEHDFLGAACATYADQTAQPGFWVSQGADWYITHGDTNDWSYGVRGGHDYTLELSDDKAPPVDELADVLGFHVEPSLRFLQSGASTGLRGRITDDDGRPVEARFLSPQAAWPGFSDPETGAFARPLPPGTYDLQFLAEGHSAVSRTVEVPVDGVLSIDVQLPRSADLVVDRVEGLEAALWGTWQGRVCGATFAEIVGAGGSATLGRPGLSGPHPLPTWAEDDCAVFTLDADVVPPPEVPEGEWSWALRDATGAVRALLPLGVLLEAAAPGYRVDDVELEADEGGVIVHVLGDDLPEGADLRFVGPQGQRLRPERLPGDAPDRLRARVDPTDWAWGSWTLRVFGNGHHVALAGVLEVDGDGLRAGPPPFRPSAPLDRAPKGEPDVELPPDAPPAEAGEGCACSNSRPPPAGLVALLPLATLLRRRSRRCDR